MEVNEQELVSTFLEITMCNCRDSALNILKDAKWNMEVAIQLFFEGDGSHREPIGLPFNSFFNFDSTIVPTGWGSEDEEVDNGQKHFDFDATGQPTRVWCMEDENKIEEGQENLDLDSNIVPTGWGLEDKVEVVEFQEHDDIEHSGWGSDDEEVDDGQNHFGFDAISQPTGWGLEDKVEVVEFQEHDDIEHSSHREPKGLPFNFFLNFDPTIVPTGWGSDDEEVDDGQNHSGFDAISQPTIWCMEDENEVEEGQEYFDLDSNIVPTGWGLEDEVEVVEFQEHDAEHRSESNAGTTEDSDWKEEGFNETNLSMLYRQMFRGQFHEAKVEASNRDRWLLVNVQASEQFNSHLLNRETWSNATVQELLRSHFVFWQINQKDDEGEKVCCFYKLMTLPAILVIDPITGEKMYGCHGMKQPEDLFEDLMRFSDRSPKQHLLGSTRRESANASTDQTVANEASQPKESSPVSTTKPSYPPLPEEPIDKKLICKVGICLPSGKRVQRSFHKTDSTKLLWSFCSTLLKEEEASKSFCFIVPASTKLIYDDERSFAEAGLSNALLRLSLGGDN